MNYRFRPSKMALIVACTGSVQMQERYPDTTGPDAAQGTVAHECLAHLLRNGSQIPLGTVVQVDGHAVTVDEDMHEGAKLAYDEVVSWGVAVQVEQPLWCGSIHPKCGGTPDIRAVDWVQRLIRLPDYKYGFGIVDPFENWQLLSYLSGTVDELGISDNDGWSVELVIIQPRASHPQGPIRTWRFRLVDVRAHFNIMRSACLDADGPNATCTPGDHCDGCSASHGCPTLQQAAYRSVAIVGKPEPFDLEAQAAARELKRLTEAQAMLSARIDGLKVRVTSDIQKGIQNQHYVIENANARRRWKEGEETAAIGIAEAMGVSIVQPRRAITPTQAMKVLDRKIVESLSYKPVGEAKLVEFDSAKTRKLFGA